MNLYSLEGDNTRPTTDRIKETIFNIIAFDVQESKFLDLFAGSGAIGIEALSRNADNCYFVDNSRDAIDIINKNVNKAKLEDKSKIINQNSLDFLKNTTETFDVVYIDPPYGKDLHNQAIDSLIEKGLINEKGIVIVEIATGDEVNEYECLKLYKQKIFKKTTVNFYSKEN